MEKSKKRERRKREGMKWGVADDWKLDGMHYIWIDSWKNGWKKIPDVNNWK